MIEIYTDGSSRHDDFNKNWVGAYAFCIYYKKKPIYYYASCVLPTTISECELLAIMHATYIAKKSYDEKITVYSDSDYAVKGLTNRINLHKNRGLWALGRKLTQDVNIQKVKGHSDVNENNHVDKLAKNKLRSYFNKH